MPSPVLSLLLFTADTDSIQETLSVLEAFEFDSELYLLSDSAELPAQKPENVEIRVVEGTLAVSERIEKALAAARGTYVCLAKHKSLLAAACLKQKITLLRNHTTVGLVYSASDTDGVNFAYLGGRDTYLALLAEPNLLPDAFAFRRSLLPPKPAFLLKSETFQTSLWELLLYLSRYAQTANIKTAVIPQPSNAEISQEISTTDLLTVWRHHLVDMETPPVLESYHWSRMEQILGLDKPSTFTEAFVALKTDSSNKIAANFEMGKVYQRNPTQRAASFTRSKCPALVWNAPFFGTDNFSLASRALALALDVANIPLTLRESRLESGIATLSIETERTLRRLISNPIVEGAVHLYEMPPTLFFRDVQARANVGRWFLDTEEVPEDWRTAFETMDAFWVASELDRRRLTVAGVAPEKIRLVPRVIDTSTYSLEVAPLAINGKHHFMFLAILPWNPTSGWDILLRAFLECFTASDNVALVCFIETTPSLPLETTLREMEAYLTDGLGCDPAQLRQILVREMNLPPDQRPNLFRGVDCFIQTSSEPVRIYPTLEAMAMGIPVIAPASGEHLEILNTNVGYPILPLHEVGGDAALIEAMRRVVAERSEAKVRGMAAREFIQEAHSLTVGVRSIVEALEYFEATH